MTWHVCFKNFSRILRTPYQNLHSKIALTGAIGWSRKELFWPYGLDYILLRRKLFVKIESWNFQHLFDIESRDTSQNFSSFSSYIPSVYTDNFYFDFFLYGLSVWAEILWGFHKIQNQTDAKNFSCLSSKTKKFYS